jgi:hypothetical protein
MRRWASNAIIFLGIPAFVLALMLGIHTWQVVRRLDFSLDGLLGTRGEGLGAALRIAHSQPDLDVEPDTPGYLSSLGTSGPQRHHYADDLDRTRIVGEVWIGDGTLSLPVVEYDGCPRRDVHAEDLRLFSGAPFAVLVVRVVDDQGKQRGQTAVTVDTLRDTPFAGRKTTWGDTGEVAFLLWPGTYSVTAPKAKRGEVSLAMHERVFCTLSPSGLKIDERKPAHYDVR